jgi:hypothetical protein
MSKHIHVRTLAALAAEPHRPGRTILVEGLEVAILGHTTTGEVAVARFGAVAVYAPATPALEVHGAEGRFTVWRLVHGLELWRAIVAAGDEDDAPRPATLAEIRDYAIQAHEAGRLHLADLDEFLNVFDLPPTSRPTQPDDMSVLCGQWGRTMSWPCAD